MPQLIRYDGPGPEGSPERQPLLRRAEAPFVEIGAPSRKPGAGGINDLVAAAHQPEQLRLRGPAAATDTRANGLHTLDPDTPAQKSRTQSLDKYHPKAATNEKPIWEETDVGAKVADAASSRSATTANENRPRR